MKTTIALCLLIAVVASGQLIEKSIDGRIMLVVTNTPPKWNLFYSTNATTWIKYMTKWDGHALDRVEIDLRTNDNRQFWKFEPIP